MRTKDNVFHRVNSKDTLPEMTNIIDTLKLFFALCIVCIHTGILNGFSNPVNWYITHLVFRLGVPFFFVTSGMFLGRKLCDRKKLAGLCRKYYIRSR